MLNEYNLWLIHNNEYGFIHKAYKKNPITAIPYIKNISFHFKNEDKFEYILLERCFTNDELKKSFDNWIDVFRDMKLLVNREAMMTFPNVPQHLLTKPRMTKRTTKMDYKINGLHITRGTFVLKF